MVLVVVFLAHDDQTFILGPRIACREYPRGTLKQTINFPESAPTRLRTEKGVWRNFTTQLYRYSCIAAGTTGSVVFGQKITVDFLNQGTQAGMFSINSSSGVLFIFLWYTNCKWGLLFNVFLREPDFCTIATPSLAVFVRWTFSSHRGQRKEQQSISYSSGPKNT